MEGRTTNSLYHKDFIRLSYSGSLGWGFDFLSRSGGDVALGHFITSLHENFPFGGLFYF